MDTRTLDEVRNNLKSGEYDGVDVMRAWLSIDELFTLRAQLASAQAEKAELVKQNRNFSAILDSSAFSLKNILNNHDCGASILEASEQSTIEELVRIFEAEKYPLLSEFNHE